MPESPDRERSAEAREIAASYLTRAGGDASLALLAAVADGLAASALVSRGFARWGQPKPRSRR